MKNGNLNNILVFDGKELLINFLRYENDIVEFILKSVLIL